MTINKNSYPYFDDLDNAIEKGYYQIMFRPGYAVQGRELTQLQSMLQTQIQRFGSHIFQEGTMVIPGNIAVDVGYSYLKLQHTYSGSPIDVTQFVGKRIVGKTSGATATVLEAVAQEGADPDTLYIKLDSGTSSTSFTGNTVNLSNSIVVPDSSLLSVGMSVSGVGVPSGAFIIAIPDGTHITLSVACTATNTSVSLTAVTAEAFVNNENIATIESSPINANTAASGATGLGSKVSITKGVFFTKGYFVLVEDQSLILDKYTNSPSYNVGLTFVDSFVTASQDATLNDPATGSTNFNAPGADRYCVSLLLSKIEPDDVASEDFISILQIKEGVIQSVATTEYSELQKTLAQRTYDESGDYTVQYFPLTVKEHLNDGTNGGLYSASNGGDETKLVLSLGPGNAYVRGNNIRTYATTNLVINKSREHSSVANISNLYGMGAYVEVVDQVGMYDITASTSINLYSAINHGGSTIGHAKVRGQEFVEGVPGSGSEIYRIHLYDVVMESNHDFSEVRSLGTGATLFGNVKYIDSNTSWAVLEDPQTNIPLVEIPTSAIKTFTDVSYKVRRRLTGTTNGSGILTFTLSASSETFDSANVSNVEVSITSSGVIIDPDSMSLNGTSKQLTITSAGHTNTGLTIIATVIKNGVDARTKTLNTVTNQSYSSPGAGNITLTHADIFELVSVTDSVTSANITSHYRLDNGQRDNYYDRGRLIFNTAYAPPSGNVTVTYRYFSHSSGGNGNGDFFSVDSYDGVIDYADIPQYTSSSGISYDLINTLDFRPRMDDLGNGFSGSGGSTTEQPVPNSAVFTDYDFYLPRLDIVVLDASGKFSVLEGSSDISPVQPKTPDNSMTLYNLVIPAYTFFTKDVGVTLVDNKRYTMRDIGKLEKRIANLEYYTSLSLLEKATADLYIDDGTGVNAFKNGFVVDNFTTFNVADVANPDCKFSLDTVNGIMRPQFSKNNVGLIDDETGSNYQLTGTQISLPYTTTAFITQPFASTYENVNPYNVFNWVGTMSLSPSSDDWYDTTKAPDINIIDDSGYNASLMAQNGNVVWNDWTTTWTGVSTTTPAGPVATAGGGNSRGGPGAGVDPRVLSGLLKKYGRLPQVAYNIPSGGHNTGYAVGVYNDIVSTQVGQTRTGIQTTVTTSTSTQIIGESIIDTSTIPYMRTRGVAFTCVGLKPNTQVYPFFDSTSVSAYVTPSTLITDSHGAVSGMFTIPNTDTEKFLCGQRVFKLTDSPTNNSQTATTSGEAIYSATGVLNTIQDTVLSTVTTTAVQNAVSDERTTIETQEVTFTTPQIWVDPLAQSFITGNDVGIFVPKIDIFFATKDPGTIPVKLQLRTMSNGYPSQTIVPNSEVVINPEDITTSEDGSVATTFEFPGLVYLQPGVEYCFVLLSNSDAYNVYISQLGQTDIISGALISAQPYAGSLFASQNASTWTANQLQDIKFTIHRCVFNTGVTGIVNMKNDDILPFLCDTDPFTTTNSSAVVSVYHPSHGLASGEFVVISGVSGTQNGITAANLNGTREVTVLDIDNYTVTAGGSASATGVCGGSGVYCQGNVIIDVANVNLQTLNFPKTSISYAMNSTPVGGALGVDYPAIVTSNNLFFSDPQVIRSSVNDDSNGGTLIVRSTLKSTNDAISPIIDTTRASVICVSNRINQVLDTDGYPAGEDSTSGGSAIARYITKNISLADGATGVNVFLSSIRPEQASINVYVKTLPTGSSASLNDVSFVHVPSVAYPAFDPTNLAEYQFQLNNLPAFSNAVVKIVLTSSDEAESPVIRDFRTIFTS